MFTRLKRRAQRYALLRIVSKFPSEPTSVQRFCSKIKKVAQTLSTWSLRSLTDGVSLRSTRVYSRVLADDIYIIRVLPTAGKNCEFVENNRHVLIAIQTINFKTFLEENFWTQRVTQVSFTTWFARVKDVLSFTF